MLHYGPAAEMPPVDQLAELAPDESPDVTIDQPVDSADIGLLRDYPVVEKLDMFEDYDVIEHLDKIAPSPQSGHEAPS
jgi:hypothetical protein